MFVCFLSYGWVRDWVSNRTLVKHHPSPLPYPSLYPKSRSRTSFGEIQSSLGTPLPSYKQKGQRAGKYYLVLKTKQPSPQNNLETTKINNSNFSSKSCFIQTAASSCGCCSVVSFPDQCSLRAVKIALIVSYEYRVEEPFLVLSLLCHCGLIQCTLSCSCWTPWL